MSFLLLGVAHNLIDQKQQASYLAKLGPLFKELGALVGQKRYSQPEALINLPADKQHIIQVKELAKTQHARNPALAVIVGIGGSNLGAQAVYEALFATLCPRVPLYFADTVDSQAIEAILAKAEHALKAGNTLVVVGISKSGNTTETVANFECFLALLIKYQPDTYQESVVAITDNGSSFWQLAKKREFSLLEIPARVGGRFSVLSTAGLFPLALAGVDIEQLCKGAQEITPLCIAASQNNPAFTIASVLAYHYAQGIAIHDLFLFCQALEGLGKWQRQLLGESLGKPSTEGKPVGITPTISIGSTDLHSVGQLYLGGPVARVTTFVWIADPDAHVKVPDMPEFNNLVPHLQKKSLHAIMEAIFKGTQKAYEERKSPFMTITMPEKNAFYIGQFLQMQMIATIYLGVLLKVNTFDQPQVELYKRNTRKILADE